MCWGCQACVLVVAGRRQDANSLNNKEITTIIRRNGFRFWGNRTPETNAYIFEVYTRTAQVLADSIAEAQFETIDSPLTPANVKDVISAIRAKLDSLVTAGKLIGASCWYDVVDNSTTNLRQGRVRIRYKYTPVPRWKTWSFTSRLLMNSLVPHLRCWEVPDGCTKTSSLFYAVCGW
ncbi:phage tail sheath family protein [Escherichia coli BCE030_MS-09]|nr:phage tail sheath family protein [Escherichia coli BCE030_MS-09]